MTKFVVDTSAFLSDPNCLKDFSSNDNKLFIPYKVLDEIDNQKGRQDPVGANARKIVRKLNRAQRKEDVDLDLTMVDSDLSLLPNSLNGDNHSDNPILSAALKIDQKYDDVIFASKDLNLQVKARSLGLECEDYESEKALREASELYSGYRDEKASQDKIDKLYRSSYEEINSNDFVDESLYPNEFLNIRSWDNQSSILLRKRAERDSLKKVEESGDTWKVEPRNREQIYALDLLKDDNVGVVSLVGEAGTGKTLLSIAAGLEQTVKERKQKYSRLVIIRPVEPVGRDLGYLPGSFSEKMHPWLKPIRDNLEEIVGDRTMLREWRDRGKIEIEALSYMRGRSIADSFIIIDEAQNLSLHEVRTALTRTSEGSKIVLTGDIKQIDNTYVDEYSNGLTHVVESFKSEEIAGHCTLTEGERSEIASKAAKLL